MFKTLEKKIVLWDLAAEYDVYNNRLNKDHLLQYQRDPYRCVMSQFVLNLKHDRVRRGRWRLREQLEADYQLKRKFWVGQF